MRSDYLGAVCTLYSGLEIVIFWGKRKEICCTRVVAASKGEESTFLILSALEPCSRARISTARVACVQIRRLRFSLSERRFTSSRDSGAASMWAARTWSALVCR